MPRYFSTFYNQWVQEENYVIDTVNNRITMRVNHFTDFATTAVSGKVYLYLPVIQKNQGN